MCMICDGNYQDQKTILCLECKVLTEIPLIPGLKKYSA